MKFDYFSTEKYLQFCEAIGFKQPEDNFLIGGLKHEQLLNNRLLLKIFGALLPELKYCKDIKFINKQKFDLLVKKYKPFHFSCTSADNINNPFLKKKYYTIIIDLEKGKEYLWEELDYSLKKQIRKAESMNFSVVRIASASEFKQYFSSLKSFRDKLGFKTVPLSVAIKQWDIMHSSNPEESCYEIFICKNGNQELLAGLGIIINPESRNFIEVASFRNETCTKNNLPANDFLKWKIVEWSHKNNYKHYDLAGVNPYAPEGSKEYNIYRFKNKWGGILSAYYTYEIFFPENKWYYPIMQYALKMMKKI